MFLSFVIKSLKLTSALQKSKIQSTILIFAMVIGDILLLGGMIFAVFQTREIIYLSTIIATFFCVCYGTGLRNLAKIYEKLLLQIMSKVLSTHQDWPCFLDKKLCQKAEIQMERNSGFEIILLIIALTFCLYSPYFYFITKPDITLDHPDLQLIPYFYPNWKTKTWTQHIIKRLFEGLTSLSCMGAYLSFIIFTMYTVTNLEVHIEEVNHLLDNAITAKIKDYMTWGELYTAETRNTCSSYIIGDLSEKKKKEFSKSIDEEFSKIIQYHQFIHRFIVDVIIFLQKPYGVVFSWYISSTILFMFVSLQVTNDYVFVMKIMSLVIHEALALYLFCNMAQTIYQANEMVMNSFYNTPWYYLLPKTRKNFLFSLTLCQRRYQVKCFGMYVVNLNLFINTLRVVYSVQNILRATQK